jgi:hypothetical protein
MEHLVWRRGRGHVIQCRRHIGRYSLEGSRGMRFVRSRHGALGAKMGTRRPIAASQVKERALPFGGLVLFCLLPSSPVFSRCTSGEQLVRRYSRWSPLGISREISPMLWAPRHLAVLDFFVPYWGTRFFCTMAASARELTRNTVFFLKPENCYQCQTHQDYRPVSLQYTVF